MATINITIPDAVMPRVLDAFAMQYEWSAASGQTKAQFAKAQLIEHMKNVVKAVEGGAAGADARRDAIEAIDNDLTLS